MRPKKQGEKPKRKRDGRRFDMNECKHERVLTIVHNDNGGSNPFSVYVEGANVIAKHGSVTCQVDGLETKRF